MRIYFIDFQIVEVTANTLVVQMNTGTRYLLRRGLDYRYPNLFKLEIDGEFFRTPKETGYNAVGKVTGNLIPVELTSSNLASISREGW